MPVISTKHGCRHIVGKKKNQKAAASNVSMLATPMLSQHLCLLATPKGSLTSLLLFILSVLLVIRLAKCICSLPNLVGWLSWPLPCSYISRDFESVFSGGSGLPIWWRLSLIPRLPPFLPSFFFFFFLFAIIIVNGGCLGMTLVVSAR